MFISCSFHFRDLYDIYSIIIQVILFHSGSRFFEPEHPAGPTLSGKDTVAITDAQVLCSFQEGVAVIGHVPSCRKCFYHRC